MTRRHLLQGQQADLQAKQRGLGSGEGGVPGDGGPVTHVSDPKYGRAATRADSPSAAAPCSLLRLLAHLLYNRIQALLKSCTALGTCRESDTIPARRGLTILQTDL